MVKTQKRWHFLLVLMDAVSMALVRMVYGLLDILAAIASFIFDARTLKNKFYAILLILCTLPIIWLDGDATATVFIALIAVPMFFSKENWVL